jgi:molybdenum cofactor biosynthesis protein B
MSESTKKHKAEALKKLGFAVFTVSTSRYQQMEKNERVNDASGDLIVALLKKADQDIAHRELISDDETMIKNAVQCVLNTPEIDAAVFCGGTGITNSDITIETVQPLLEKVLPGFGEIFRQLSYAQIGSAALLSRAIAGISKGKVFFCIPGSQDAVKLCFERLILTEAGHIVKHARE